MAGRSVSARTAMVATFVVAVAVPLFTGVASARTSAVPKTIVGCWHRHFPALPVGTPAGVWLMKITANGQLTAYTPGATACGAAGDFTATVSVAGNRLTIGAVPVCSAQGVYSWKAAAKTLTLKATADKLCTPRTLLFTGVWKKK